ncbi:MAG: PAS domain S-box protein [Crocinitomicaceae bacterium]
MNFHKLLDRQIKKHFGNESLTDSKLQAFLSAVNSSYLSFERDKHLMEHAFSVSENEYDIVQHDLISEINIRNESLEKLKRTIRALSPEIQFIKEESNEDLLQIAEILENQILETNQVRAKLELFKNIIDSSSDAIQVAYETGKMFYINKSSSERIGIPMDKIRDFSVSDIEKMFHDNPDEWLKHVEQIKHQNELLLEGTTINKTTGKTIPTEVTVKHVEIGENSLVIAISRDITERKEHDKLFKLQEEKYRNIISNMNLGLLEVDNDDGIVFCNSSFERMSGFTINQMIGKQAKDLFMEGNEKLVIDDKNRRRQKGKSDSYEIQVLNKDRENKWWLISGAPNFNDDGEIIGSIGIHLDITEQKKLEQELEIAYRKTKQAAEAKEAFLANMSHEIRTPLNAIIGMIREMGREELSQKQKGFLSRTDSAANHLLSIVNSILDMSKIEAGEFQLDEETFSMPTLLNNIESILKGKAIQKKLDFHNFIDPQISKAHVGDASRLRQIFINLLDNAIKFTEKGSVTLKTESLFENTFLQKIRFTIHDTGIGMDQAYLQQIFTKFSQAEKSTSRRFGGTGLGMPITKELIQIMGGNIEIESEKDTGTTVYIDLTLPIGDINQLQSDKLIAEKNALIGTKVLLVEDNEMNRFVALQSLQYFGCSTQEAENGLIALEKLKQHKFDVILMDIQMPEMDGVMTTQNIREVLHLDVPIIAVTANAFKEDIDLYLSIGMNDYVTKPFDEYKLFLAIAKAIDQETSQKKSAETRLAIPEDDTRLYDVSKLRELSHGNEEFVQKMIGIFKENLPASLKEMQIALGKSDYQTIASVAHKLKPSIENMGIHRLDGVAREIEMNCKTENINKTELEKKVEFFLSELEKVLYKL